MSWEPLVCSKCEVEAEFERVGQVSPPVNFGVSWLCPSCGARLLDVVPIGVEVPAPGGCLNCGGAVDVDQVCGACGLPRAPLVAAIHQQCGDPPDVAAAEALAARGLIRLALNALDLRLESRPDDPESWLAKARMLNSVGAQTIVALERALALGGDLGVRLALAMALAASDQHERAVASFDEYLQTGGRDRGLAWSRQARSLRALDREDEAERLLERALAEEPDDLQLRVDLHVLLHARRRYAEALIQLDLALPQLDPGDRIRLLPARAELLCELLREDEALVTIEEALEHMPNDPRALYTHSRALANLGRLDEARVSMARVLELAPDNPAAARALAQIDAALADG